MSKCEFCGKLLNDPCLQFREARGCENFDVKALTASEASLRTQIAELTRERDALFQEKVSRWIESLDSDANKRADKFRAERDALRERVEWRPIEEAPKDGTRFLAIHNKEVRVVAWGKTSHLPWQGFCLADQGAEDFDLIDGLHLWMPFPPVDGAE